MVSPAPADELAQLLEDKQIQDAACGYIVVVIVRDAIPVEALDSLGKGRDERDREGVGVPENLIHASV